MHILVDAAERTFADIGSAASHVEDPTRLARALSTLLAEAGAMPVTGLVAPVGAYRRHLLTEGPAGFSVWAFVWGPGSATPIHDHDCWCLAGTALGELTETRYVRQAAGIAVPITETRLGPGAIESLDPALPNIHRVENRTGTVALSIHVYGFATDARETSIGAVYKEMHLDEIFL